MSFHELSDITGLDQPDELPQVIRQVPLLTLQPTNPAPRQRDQPKRMIQCADRNGNLVNIPFDQKCPEGFSPLFQASLEQIPKREAPNPWPWILLLLGLFLLSRRKQQ